MVKWDSNDSSRHLQIFKAKICVSGEIYEIFLAHHESRKKLANFVSRTLDYFGFCVRKSTVYTNKILRCKKWLQFQARYCSKKRRDDVPKNVHKIHHLHIFALIIYRCRDESLESHLTIYFVLHFQLVYVHLGTCVDLTLFARLRITKFSSFFATISSLEL